MGAPGTAIRQFPNAAARAAAAPAFASQIAIQTDNQTIYRGSAATVGAWTLIPTVGPAGPAGPAGAAGSAGTGGGARVFADTPALTAATPAFVGELAVNLDQWDLLVANTTTAGDWDSILPTVPAQPPIISSVQFLEATTTPYSIATASQNTMFFVHNATASPVVASYFGNATTTIPAGKTGLLVNQDSTQVGGVIP
jgi:hypothetical protein